MITESTRKEDVIRKWWLVDVEGVVLGRAASEIAKILRGKHKPTYTPHVDTGDYVVVINADKVKVTGNKELDKVYHRHTGWVGGLRTTNVRELREQKPCDIIGKAVKGMIPRGPLGRHMYSKLKIHAGPEHSQGAQQPVQINLFDNTQYKN